MTLTKQPDPRQLEAEETIKAADHDQLRKLINGLQPLGQQQCKLIWAKHGPEQVRAWMLSIIKEH